MKMTLKCTYLSLLALSMLCKLRLWIGFDEYQTILAKNTNQIIKAGNGKPITKDFGENMSNSLSFFFRDDQTYKQMADNHF
jgi:hypothetical protein